MKLIREIISEWKWIIRNIGDIKSGNIKHYSYSYVTILILIYLKLPVVTYFNKSTSKEKQVKQYIKEQWLKYSEKVNNEIDIELLQYIKKERLDFLLKNIKTELDKRNKK